MKTPLVVRLNAQSLHRRFQRGLPAALRGVGIKALQVIHLGQRLLKAEKVYILLQNAYVVAAPGDINAVLSAPLSKLGHALRKSGRVAQNLLVEAGHALDAGMNGQIVRGVDGDAQAVHNFQPLVELCRANLDHLTQEAVPHAAVNRTLIAGRLVPLQIQNDVLHAFQNSKPSSITLRFSALPTGPPKDPSQRRYAS